MAEKTKKQKKKVRKREVMTKLGGTKCQGNREKEGNELIIFFFFFFLCRARKHWLIKNISFERRKRSFNERNPLDKNVLTISNSLLYTSRPMLREISLRLFRKLRQASEAYEDRESMKENMERYPFDRFHLVFQLCC